MSAMEAIVKYLAEADFKDIPEQTVKKQKELLIDTLGVAVAGSKAQGVESVVDLFDEIGGKAESTLLVFGRKLPCLHAAMANSLMAHSLDFDDMHEPAGVHANVCVVPPALAAAERVGGVDGKTLLAAVILGVDLVCRMGASIPLFTGWHSTTTFGVFGAAAAAAKIIGLDETGIANALGIAYSQSSGNRQARLEGTLTKRLQPALAAKAGLLAALLASKGMTGPHDILEGDWGMLRLYTGPSFSGNYGAITAQLTQGLGNLFYGDGLSIKPYPCCKATHTAIAGALHLLDTHPIAADQIEKVEISVSNGCYQTVGRPFVIKTNPQVDAQFSIPYTVATALLEGKLGLEDFTEAKIRDARRMCLAKKVIVSIDPSLQEPSGNVVNLTARIVIRAGGKTYFHQSLTAKGHPQHPMDRREIFAKFAGCLQFGDPRLFEKREEILQTVLDLEQLKDVRELAECLCSK